MSDDFNNDFRFGTWDIRRPDYNPKQQPKYYNIVPVYMPTPSKISCIIEDERKQGRELKAYIESPMPHGANHLPGILIFKKDPFPILSEEISLMTEIIYDDKLYRRIIKKLKKLLNKFWR